MKPIGRPPKRMKKSCVWSSSSPRMRRRYFSSSSSGYVSRGGSAHQRLMCGSRSQDRIRGRSASVSGGKSYSGVFGEAEAREGLGLGHAVVGPAAALVVRADLLGDVLGIEPHARQDAGDVRLHRLLRQLVVRRAEAFAVV